MGSSEALNLEAIQQALDQHAERCEYPAIEIRMNPFEVERLGWDDFKGIPIVGDDKIGTGRVRVICEREEVGGPAVEATEEKKIEAPVL